MHPPSQAEKRLQGQQAAVAVPRRRAGPRAGGTESCDMSVPQCWRAESNGTQNRLWAYYGDFLMMWKRKIFWPKKKKKKATTSCVTVKLGAYCSRREWLCQQPPAQIKLISTQRLRGVNCGTGVRSKAKQSPPHATPRLPGRAHLPGPHQPSHEGATAKRRASPKPCPNHLC